MRFFLLIVAIISFGLTFAQKTIKVIDLDVCGVKKFKDHKFDMWTNTGTLLYRAPETFGVGYEEKVDIWSLGTLVYELVSGEVPFKT